MRWRPVSAAIDLGIRQFSDDFSTQAVNQLGPNWDVYYGDTDDFTVVVNTVENSVEMGTPTVNDPAIPSFAVVHDFIITQDQWAKAELTFTAVAFIRSGVGVMMGSYERTSGRAGYSLTWQQDLGRLLILRVARSQDAVLILPGIVLALGDTIRLQVVVNDAGNNELEAFHNEVSVGTVTDSDADRPTEGKPGVAFSSSNLVIVQRWTNFECAIAGMI